MGEKIGILTGGGDAPGLNAVIRAIILRGTKEYNYKFIGLLDGWRGLLEKKTSDLTPAHIRDIINKGGTILGTSRTNPLKLQDGVKNCKNNFEQLGLHALIAIGGDDTLGVATALNEKGIKVIGVPKTIDNDLSSTDYTFGFFTAVERVSEAIDRLRTTAASHHRVMVIEVMGRYAGWITLYSGIAGGADVIVLPETPFTFKDVAEKTKKALENRKERYSIVVVAEGAKLFAESDLKDIVVQDYDKDEFGHVRLGGIGKIFADELEKRIGAETRYVVLGHLQRGGSPSAFDRILSTRYGLKAIELVAQGKFGYAPVLDGKSIKVKPLKELTEKTKTVPESYLQEFKIFLD